MQPHLSVQNLHAGYGDVAVLHGISFDVAHGAIVAIVGANGAGKTTLLSSIAGLNRASAGQILFAGNDIAHRRADELPEQGLALVPEGGRLFPFMTVRENLELGAYARSSRAHIAQRLDEVQEIFPILKDRQSQMAGKLSGGERQMCAIARALMSKPKLLMLDEPSVGLSPLMAERVLETVAKLAAGGGLTVIIVEQRVTEVLEIAHEAHILDHGRIAQSGSARTILTDPMVQETYMGL
jgi:branched-chain amino acid transport system ATP-binding protein